METWEQNIHELTGVYVLDALADSERDSFETHLRVCPSCVAEVAELRRAVIGLAGEASFVPPAVLWQRISENIGCRTAEIT